MTYTVEKPVIGQAVEECPLITIEFFPKVHPDETEYSHPHPRFVFGDRVTPINEYPAIKYKVCALELIESKTPSGRLLNQPYWKYKISNEETKTSYWKEESALVCWKERQSTNICADCQHFQDFNELNGKGWCNLGARSLARETRAGSHRCFERSAKAHHTMTNDCVLNGSKELKAFPSEMIEAEEDSSISTYEIGAIVRVIDSDEHHTEWGTFEILECRYDADLLDWNYFLLPLDTTAVFDEPLWVKENEICPVELAHNVDTRDIF